MSGNHTVIKIKGLKWPEINFIIKVSFCSGGINSGADKAERIKPQKSFEPEDPI